jgi:hypothetical protein
LAHRITTSSLSFQQSERSFLQQRRWAPKLARRILHGQTGWFLQAWDREPAPTLADSHEYWRWIHIWWILWLLVWKINYLEALKNRTNLCTNPMQAARLYEWDSVWRVIPEKHVPPKCWLTFRGLHGVLSQTIWPPLWEPQTLRDVPFPLRSSLVRSEISGRDNRRLRPIFFFPVARNCNYHLSNLK